MVVEPRERKGAEGWRSTLLLSLQCWWSEAQGGGLAARAQAWASMLKWLGHRKLNLTLLTPGLTATSCPQDPHCAGAPLSWQPDGDLHLLIRGTWTWRRGRGILNASTIFMSIQDHFECEKMYLWSLNCTFIQLLLVKMYLLLKFSKWKLYAFYIWNKNKWFLMLVLFLIDHQADHKCLKNDMILFFLLKNKMQ